jgi:hypothetical protein
MEFDGAGGHVDNWLPTYCDPLRLGILDTMTIHHNASQEARVAKATHSISRSIGEMRHAWKYQRNIYLPHARETPEEDVIGGELK